MIPRAVARLTLAVGAALVARPALAHHSFAPHFDASKPVSISGTITEFEARNPHSYLHIAAIDENGKTQEYVCESHGVTQLSRNGITPSTLRPEQDPRQGSLSRHSPYMCFFDHVEFADGRMLNVNSPAGAPPRARQTRRRTSSAPGCLRRVPNRSTSGPQPMIQSLTPAGEKAVAAYDPFKDDPTFRCDPVAIRRVWGAPATPLEIVKQRIRHRAAPRVDGRPPRRAHEHEGAPQRRAAHVARPLHRPLRRRDARRSRRRITPPAC